MYNSTPKKILQETDFEPATSKIDVESSVLQPGPTIALFKLGG